MCNRWLVGNTVARGRVAADARRHSYDNRERPLGVVVRAGGKNRALCPVRARSLRRQVRGALLQRRWLRAPRAETSKCPRLMHCCSARTPSLVLCRADEGNSVLRVKGAVVVMPGSYSSAGVGASHRPRPLWIPRVQRPPPLNPGDCSGRGKMPARAAESSPSATQQCSCRLCLPLSPSAHSPCAESPARAHRVATSFSFSGGSAQGLSETSLFRRFTFTSKACCQSLATCTGQISA